MTEQETVKLFARLQARYGHKWTSQFSTPEMTRLAVAEWAIGLQDLTSEQIQHGLNTFEGDWPPSLPEFRRACIDLDMPETNEEWLALGRRIGVLPRLGEEWPSYISRAKRAFTRQGTNAERSPLLTMDVEKLTHGH